MTGNQSFPNSDSKATSLIVLGAAELPEVPRVKVVRKSILKYPKSWELCSIETYVMSENFLVIVITTSQKLFFDQNVYRKHASTYHSQYFSVMCVYHEKEKQCEF